MSQSFTPYIPVEETFNEFVKEFGGELVSELISGSSTFNNADYLFANRSVVAELKCLEKDTFQDREIRKKMGILYDKWIRQGLIQDTPIRPTKFETKYLPIKCQLDAVNLIKRPIDEHIKKANRQIKRTKEYFDLPDAKGLLLLVNDGNYSLESDAILKLAGRLMKVHYTAINSLIYFTVNMPPAGRAGIQPVSIPSREVSDSLLRGHPHRRYQLRQGQ